jgi:hypothetical protein
MKCWLIFEYENIKNNILFTYHVPIETVISQVVMKQHAMKQQNFEKKFTNVVCYASQIKI